MQHLLKGRNFGLLCSKQANLGFRHSLITNILADMNLLANAGLFACGMVFTIYLYTDDEQLDLSEKQERESKLDKKSSDR